MKPARAAQAQDRRQIEGKDDRSRYGRELGPELRDDGVCPFRPVGALAIGFEADDEEGLVGGGQPVDEIVSDHGEHALDAGDRSDDFLDLLYDLLGAVDRSALGQPHGGKEGPLILLGQEALRRRLEQTP